MIGIWIHHDRTAGQSGRRAAGEYRKARCGYANVYRGRKGIPTQIDTICGSCGKRVRFNPVRLTWKKGIGKRGSVRQAQWLYQNHKGGLPALEEIAKGLNEVDESYHDEGFSTASELLKEKTEPPIGAKTDPEKPEWKLKAWKDLNRRLRDVGIDELTWEQFDESEVSKNIEW